MISQSTIEALKEDLIQQRSYPKELKKLEAILGDSFCLLEDCEAIVAGGAITSIMTNKEVNDVDIYFRSKEMFSKFLAGIYCTEYEHLTIVNFTERSVLFTNHRALKAQAIVFRFFEDAQSIFDTFDFTINMGAYDFKKQAFEFHEDFFKHNAQRFIGINENTAFPLISVLRLEKYRERGYKTSKPQLLKLLLAVNSIVFDSWEDLLSHVGGMYGIDPEKIFDKSKPFTREEAMTQLEALVSLEEASPWQPANIEMSVLVKGVEKHLTEEFVQLILGKNDGNYFYPNSSRVKDYYNGSLKEEPSVNTIKTLNGFGNEPLWIN